MYLPWRLNLPCASDVRTLCDLRAEQRLDGALDVDLVGVHRHLEHQRPAVLAEDRGLLGDERAPDDVCQFHGWPLNPAPPAASRAPPASARRGACSITSRALTRLLAQHPHALDVAHRQRQLVFRLHVDEQRLARRRRARRSISTAAFVLISPTLSASTTVTAPSRSFCVSAARSAPFSTFFGSW